MTSSSESLVIQVWTAGLDSSLLQSGLSAAGLEVIVVQDLFAISDERPLLLIYGDPHALGVEEECDSAAAAICSLVSLLPGIEARSLSFRLINFACMHIPAVVGWCIQSNAFSGSGSGSGSFVDFVRPDPLHALLALKLLNRHPSLEAAYLALEGHPLSAALDCRPPDRFFRERYHSACGWEALLEARAEQAALDHEIRELALMLGTRETHLFTIHRQAEQLHDLAQRIAEGEAMRHRCVENTSVIQAQQDDLEALAHRQALLEDLVRRASEASLSLQTRLSQLLW